jgi:hypothetical protein
MNEDTTPTPASAPASSAVAKRPIWQSIPLIHLILAGIIVVFSLLGYIPANERPEANTTELRSYPEGSTAEQKTKIDEENKKISKDNEEAEKKPRKPPKSGRNPVVRTWNPGSRFVASPPPWPPSFG